MSDASSQTAAVVAPRAAGRVRQVVADYVEMTKPKVQSLLLFTTVTTMYVAGDPSLGLILLTCGSYGNVIRILARVFNVADDVTETATKNALWALAETLVPPGRAGAWNEGLMELGRVICTPKSPDCPHCPIAAHCTARALGVQEERPVRPPRAKTPHFDVTAAVIRRSDGRILIAQRRPEGLLGGLWEFPGGKREPGETLRECLRREIREELDLEIAVGEQIGVVWHGYTHFRITLYAFACDYLGGTPQTLGVADWAWVTLDELSAYAFPVTDRKIIAMLRDGGQLGMDLI